ncbi:unnamed protein product [marine sediment metagenome]|uniref:Uncharacterized protein n=1 Tax=marine sediment metagenome TaxID=412755 RepID=X0XCR1_9ZZZZ
MGTSDASEACEKGLTGRIGGPTFHANGVLEYLAVKKVGKKTDKKGILYRVKHVPAAK